jgi:hypothetical protein
MPFTGRIRKLYLEEAEFVRCIVWPNDQSADISDVNVATGNNNGFGRLVNAMCSSGVWDASPTEVG